MCGIAGIYHYGDGRPVDRDLLLAMRDRLTHRGPDDAGLRVEGPIGLSQRRLSIVDRAEAGRNPPANGDDTRGGQGHGGARPGPPGCPRGDTPEGRGGRTGGPRYRVGDVRYARAARP